MWPVESAAATSPAGPAQLLAVSFLRSRHSIKGDVKRKYFPAELKAGPCSTASSPYLRARVRPSGCLPILAFPSYEEAFFRTARSGQGRADKARRSRPLTARTVLRHSPTRERTRELGRLQSADKQNRCQVATMILFETRGLQLYWVVRGGIQLLGDAVPLQAHSPMVLIDTHPRTRALGEPDHTCPKGPRIGRHSPDVHAVCDFNCFPSNRSPFFHTAKVIAAILRAKVRRAMLGLIDLASNAV